MTSLSLFYTHQEMVGNNFVDVPVGKSGYSPGPAMASRESCEGLLVVLLHDSVRNRGCLALCGPDHHVATCISGMVHFMVNRWGSIPSDLELLIAGGLVRPADFTLGLAKHLDQMGVGRRCFDLREKCSGRPLGVTAHGSPPRHLFYDPAKGQVELYCEAHEPGGRLYSSDEAVTISEV